MTDTIQVIMSELILDKIKYLCREISKVEWSGIILYTVVGTIQKPKEMSLILQDIIPMNKGTQVYTEYQFNEKKRDSSDYDDRMIDYFCENPKALEEDWKMGHIHSHNTMNVYFSSTDISELEDNCPSHNFYFSLIVNNFMEFTAKVAFLATIETVVTAPYKTLDESGEEYIISSSKLSVKKNRMFMYDCEIEAPETKKILVDDIFFNSVKDIIKLADIPVTPLKKVGFKPYIPASNFAKKVQKPFINVNSALNHSKRHFSDAVFNKEEEENDDLAYHTGPGITETDVFIVTLLRNGVGPDEVINTVEDALEQIEAFKETIDYENLSNSILEVLPEIFEDFYEEEANDDDFFMSKIEEIVEVFELYETQYTFLSRVILTINNMLSKFKENATTV